MLNVSMGGLAAFHTLSSQLQNNHRLLQRASSQARSQLCSHFLSLWHLPQFNLLGLTLIISGNNYY